MGTITYMNLVDRAARVLKDAGHDRWTMPELLDWIADAERAVVRIRPDANAVNTDIELVAGTRQTIPDDAYRLISIYRNVGGQAITPINRNVIDAQKRGWHNDAPAAEVDHFIYDDRDPRTFYVSPPALAGSLIEGVVSQIPAIPIIVSGNETLVVGDAWAEPILDRTLWRAFSKDAESSPSNAQRAAAHMATFEKLMGIYTQTDTAMSPNNGNA